MAGNDRADGPSGPIRVLWVIKGLGPGGAERLLVSLAQVRDPSAVAYEAAYLLAWKTHLVGELEAEDVPTHLLSPRRGLSDPAWPRRLRRLVARGGYDVVHLHSPAVAAITRPLLRTLRPHPPTVATEHNVWGSFTTTTRLANALTLPLDAARLAVSEEVRQSVWAPLRDRCEVVVQGIPVERLRARLDERSAARAELGFADDEVVIATVANLRATKDYPTLLAAAAQVIAAEPLVRFVSVGQGPLEAEVRAEAGRLGLGDRFRFLGYRADPGRVLAAADVFTLSSRHEGLPIALLEAMALGLPSVVTAVGGVPAVVRDGVHALVVPPGRPERLATAYRRLVGAPEERRRLGSAAAQRVADFDVSSTARRLESVYRRVVTSRRGR